MPKRYPTDCGATGCICADPQFQFDAVNGECTCSKEDVQKSMQWWKLVALIYRDKLAKKESK